MIILPEDLSFVRETAERKYDQIVKMNRAVWEYAELNFREEKSAAILSGLLEKEGFAVQRDLAGLKTAFTARFGEGKPVIGILAEYDALPHLGQTAGSARKDPDQETKNGHGCGHSALGAGSIGAALIVKNFLEKHDLPGSVILYGCPAEEGGNGKVYMVRAGLFRDLDAAILWHPADRNLASPFRAVANFKTRFTFHGISAHAGKNPEEGRSALDACELMNIGVNYLREHITSTTRIHYAYENPGGNFPSVVPDYASINYYVRAANSEEARAVLDRVIDIARGAALMSGTQMEYEPMGGLSDFYPNLTVSNVLSAAFCAVGGPDFDEKEDAIAREFLQTFPDPVKEKAILEGSQLEGIDPDLFVQRPLIRTVVPGSDSDRNIILTSSFDAGDVSYVVPTSQIYAAVGCIGTSLHSWQLTGQTGSSIGDKAAQAAARALALAAILFYRDPSLLKKAKEEFDAEIGNSYRSPLPDELVPPRF
ncbi:MAG: amidohydrolase [Planctomycetia bacterium]|nr:amidohydrolase [Planctomycetia bacterium]